MPTGSRTLRILVVAPTSFFSDTGCHVRILEEVRILERLGHHVEIATYRNGGPANQLRIHRTLPIPWRRGWEVGSSRHKVAFDLLLGLTVLRLLATRRFDLIHAHLHEGGLIGAIAGRLFRKPMLLDLQGSLTEEMIDHGFLSRDSRFFRPMLALEKWIVGQGDRVVASTAHFSRLCVERYGCSPADGAAGRLRGHRCVPAGTVSGTGTPWRNLGLPGGDVYRWLRIRAQTCCWKPCRASSRMPTSC